MIQQTEKIILLADMHLERATPVEIAIGGLCHFDSELFALIENARNGHQVAATSVVDAAKAAQRMLSILKDCTNMGQRIGDAFGGFLTARQALYAQLIELREEGDR